MEFTVNVKLSADAPLTALLIALLGQVPKPAAKTEDAKEEKAQKAVKATAAKEKASENGVEVDLSTIRQHLAKSEENKAAARKLLRDEFNVEKLTDLDKKDFVAFYTKLTAVEKDDL